MYKTKKYNDDFETDFEETPEQRARDYATKAMGQAFAPSKVPTIGIPPVPNKGVKPYNPGIDYTAKMNDAIARGDYGAAAEYERLHNVKNGDLGLGYANSGIFNYLDTKGLGGLKEGKYKELEDHYNKGFQYNYEEDTEYKAMRRLKEKEAEKAYNDGYAQLSSAFDGDIPVNMINKLLTTKSEITDQADSYIPQLRAMAYDMYLGKGNALYNQYNMLASEEATDYNRWLSDRDMFISGVENAYGRRWNEEGRDYSRGRDAIADERYAEELAYNRDWLEKEYTNDNYWRFLDNQYRNAALNK